VTLRSLVYDGSTVGLDAASCRTVDSARNRIPRLVTVSQSAMLFREGSYGPGVTAFEKGDEVYGMAGGVGGLQGTLAEFAAVDIDLLARNRRTFRCARRRPFHLASSLRGRD